VPRDYHSSIMRLLQLVVGFLIFSSFAIAVPTSTPTSAPSSAPGSAPGSETLADGAISFDPPPGWSQALKSPNGRTIAYVSTQPVKATMAVNADHQDVRLDSVAAAKIGEMQCKKIADNAAKSNIQILDPPHVESDDHYFLRIHHRFKKGENVGDQLQLYRVIKSELVAVAVTAYAESPDQAKTVFDEAEKVMQSVRGAGSGESGAASMKPPSLANKPLALSQAKIRLSPPEGWRAELNDAASGMVATFHDPADSTNLVAVSVRQLPKEARTDPKMRDALLQEMASGEKAQIKIDGAEPVGETQTITDRRFLHKTRTHYKSGPRRFDVSSRQLRAGEAIVSVSVVSLEDKFETIDKLADQVALSIRAGGR
jgi:hypothetical protein